MRSARSYDPRIRNQSTINTEQVHKDKWKGEVRLSVLTGWTHALVKERVRIMELANHVESVSGSLSQQPDLFLVESRDEWPGRQKQ